MSVTPQEIYTLASPMAEGVSEAEWRFGASKIYYAAFHKSLEYVDLCPDNTHLTMGSHERLSDRFMSQNTSLSKGVAYALIAMKKIRKIADYEVDGEFPQRDALQQRSSYLHLEKRLDAFRAECDGKQLVAAS